MKPFLTENKSDMISVRSKRTFYLQWQRKLSGQKRHIICQVKRDMVSVSEKEHDCLMFREILMKEDAQALQSDLGHAVHWSQMAVVIY